MIYVRTIWPGDSAKIDELNGPGHADSTALWPRFKDDTVRSQRRYSQREKEEERIYLIFTPLFTSKEQSPAH
jgi:hypothetical protein